ncbi:MAG: hypothetical protein MUP15_04075, partial [Dehalococcoidia bacterium]|nr:hypothetical protein [Dehalococcoidia bacterium]
RYLRGDLASLAPLAVQDPERTWARTTTAVHDGGEGKYGYCTEFLVSGEKLNAGATLERMLELGDSVLVVGDETLLRVHLHTAQPEIAISHGRMLGELTQIKVENIEAQAEQFVARVQASGHAPDIGVVGTVVVVSGAGLEEVFRSLGATAVVPGGATMNPSIKQVLEAIESCPQEEVIVLPNTKNVILGAQQAARSSRKRVRVVGTVSVPQGMAALLALNPERGLDENAALMGDARRDVQTVEVTKAVRTTTVGGLRVRVGQDIALLDGTLAVAEHSPRAAVRESLRRLVNDRASLITIYYGAQSTAEDTEALAGEIRAVYPSLQVDIVYGGQPHYSYIVSLE